MDNELIKKIKHDIFEFHPEKFKLKLVDVGQILEEAERKRFDFDRHNGDADDLLVSCMCYIHNSKHREVFPVRLYCGDTMPTEKKFQILQKYETLQRYCIPKTLDEAFLREYKPQEVAAYVDKMFKAAKENPGQISFITPHVKEAHDNSEINQIANNTQMSREEKIDHMKSSLTGDRIIRNKKMDSYFSESIDELAFELQSANKDKIVAWLCSEDKELTLDFDFKRTIGVGADMNFCIRETNVGRIVMKKDSVNDGRHSVLGGIGITFFPDILKGEPQERIASIDLYHNFNKAATHVTTPLYRTYANLTHALNGRRDVSFQYTEKGFLDVYVDVSKGKGFRINLNNFNDEVTLHDHEMGKPKIYGERPFEYLSECDKIFKTNYKLLLDEVIRCHEEQMKIGQKFFDEEITEETKKQITFDINEELI